MQTLSNVSQTLRNLLKENFKIQLTEGILLPETEAVVVIQVEVNGDRSQEDVLIQQIQILKSVHSRIHVKPSSSSCFQ